MANIELVIYCISIDKHLSFDTFILKLYLCIYKNDVKITNYFI